MSNRTHFQAKRKDLEPACTRTFDEFEHEIQFSLLYDLARAITCELNRHEPEHVYAAFRMLKGLLGQRRNRRIGVTK